MTLHRVLGPARAARAARLGTLADVPRHMSRLVNCPCGRTVMVSLGGAFPIECLCGLDYDPRTGEPQPVCEGFEIPRFKRPGSRRSSSLA